MEAFDVLYRLCRYHNYSQDEVEATYLLLLQAEALETTLDPLLTGLLCFYRIHDVSIAEKILCRSATADDVMKEISIKQKKNLPKKLATVIRQVKEM